MVLLVIAMPFASIAEEIYTGTRYSFDYTPEISVDLDGGALHVDVIPVKLGWDTVYRDETVHSYLHAPNDRDARKIIDIMITDTDYIVHAELDEPLSETFVYFSFDTLVLRYFSSGNHIYMFVVYKE